MALGTFKALVTQIVKLGPTLKEEKWVTIGSTFEADSAAVAEEVGTGGLVDVTPPAPTPPPPAPSPEPAPAPARARAPAPKDVA